MSETANVTLRYSTGVVEGFIKNGTAEYRARCGFKFGGHRSPPPAYSHRSMEFGILIPLPASARRQNQALRFAAVLAKDHRYLIYGFTTGLYPMMIFFGAPILGQLSDRVGPKNNPPDLRGRNRPGLPALPLLWDQFSC